MSLNIDNEAQFDKFFQQDGDGIEIIEKDEE